MDTELKAKWVAALRSGKYEQGKECLRSKDNRFCCLGVLADVMGGKWEIGPAPKSRYSWSDGLTGRRFTDLNNTFVPDREQETLMRLNDGNTDVSEGPLRAGVSFATIADYIEANLG